MTVAIEKENLIHALDNGQVTFHAEGDLTPTEIYELLQKNADCLADTSGKNDVDIEPLFPNEPVTKIATHEGKRPPPQFCKTKV